MSFSTKYVRWLIVACALATPFASAAVEQWRQFYAEADEQISEQKFGSAEQLLRKALALMPNDTKHNEDRSKIYLKLANTLSLNNQTGEAQTYYQKLLDLEERHHGNDSSRIVPALLALGSIQEAEGDHSAAMQYYRRALKINERHYGPYSPAVADNLQKLGHASWRAGDKSESSSHYRRSIGILLQQPGLNASDQLLSVMSDYSDKMKGNDNSNRDLLTDFKRDILANKQQAVGDNNLRSPDKSKKQKGKFSTDDVIGTDVKPTPRYSPAPRQPAAGALQTAGSWQSSDTGSLPLRAPIRSNSSGSDSPSAADQQTLAMVPQTQPSFSEQDRIRLNAIKEQQTNMDPLVLQKNTVAPITSNTLSPAFTVLNSSLSRQSRYNQSADNLERSIAADIDALGANHPTVANDLTNLAQIKIADGKYAEARGLLYKAIPIYEKVYGLNNALTINAVSSLAYVEGQCGNTDLALTLYKKALAAGQAVLGPNSLEIARILNEMAHLFYSQGKLPEARTYYEWAVASTQAAVGDHDALLAACLRDYAQVLRTMGEENEASAVELRAKKIAFAPANQ